MSKCRLLLPVVLLPVMLLVVCAGWVQAEEEAPGFELEIERVLGLGPLPLGRLEDSAKAGEVRRAAVNRWFADGPPEDGQRVEAFGQTVEWRSGAPSGAADDGAWQAWSLMLETGRFVEGALKLEGLRDAELWRDGIKETVGDGEAALKLHQGSHWLLILHRGAAEDADPGLRWAGKAEHDRVRAHTEPRRRVSARLLTNAETVSSLTLSPDGRYLALAFSGRLDAADLDLARLQIRDLDNDRVVQQWTAGRPSSLEWSPDGRWLALREGDNLWLRDVRSGESRLLLANHEHLGAWRWHPDSGSILFLWTEPYKDENARTRRYRALEDRWDTFRDNAQLFQVDRASGLVRALTTGKRSVRLHDVDPDGGPGSGKVLLSERLIDYAEPPHSLFRLFELDLAGGEERSIGELRLLNDARFARDGYWLLSGPGLARGDGAVVPEGRVPNEYDTQLYRLSADGETAVSHSRDFDPAIGGIHRLDSGELLLPVTEGERVLLYRYQPDRQRFVRIETGLDILEEFTASRGDRPVLVARGADVDAPQRVHRIDLQRNRASVVIDSMPGQYPGVVLGQVRDFAFTNSAGVEIPGRYYLPPDFDPDGSYPVIVYYYGGTTPVNRQFTGRYPFHLWAAKGYVVYILQPRGTIGYGQELSALHVNAWGDYAADDIIEGARAFAAAHEFADGERMGNIGASYGGFMTMHVATRTDLFQAAVSHAGISALTSYWGQGWWGYGYSGIASRDSFPWNNPELYVGQSPVYSADRITTPLLLLTGDSDTNVPPGESHNMFTALKLLGREVELIEVPGEDHWILDREKRYAWWDAMLAWFDYWLKDQPEWWYSQYPDASKD